jgi:hypothetical protein
MASNENAGRQRVVGGELELDTKVYKGFTLKSGYHFESIKLLNYSDVRIFEKTDKYGFNLALSYDGGKGLKAILKGHYMWWNEPSFWEAKYNGLVAQIIHK